MYGNTVTAHRLHMRNPATTPHTTPTTRPAPPYLPHPGRSPRPAAAPTRLRPDRPLGGRAADLHPPDPPDPPTRTARPPGRQGDRPAYRSPGAAHPAHGLPAHDLPNARPAPARTCSAHDLPYARCPAHDLLRSQACPARPTRHPASDRLRLKPPSPRTLPQPSHLRLTGVVHRFPPPPAARRDQGRTGARGPRLRARHDPVTGGVVPGGGVAVRQGGTGRSWSTVGTAPTPAVPGWWRR